MHYGLIGYPLSHSVSRQYFSQKFEREQLSNCRYDLFAIEHIDLLPDLLQQNPNLCGLNVTIPYKQSVLAYINEQSPAVQQIGAVNCIKIKQGRLIGYNTDVIGFEQSLIPLLQAHHKAALVLGNGGAAKAVCWVLQKLGIPYTIVSRQASNNNNNNSLSYEAITAHIMAQHTIVVNTTPLGMYPNTDAAPALPYHFFSPNHLCYDLVYNPTETRFMQQAAKYGAVTKNGLDMLHLQAEAAWAIWNE